MRLHQLALRFRQLFTSQPCRRERTPRRKLELVSLEDRCVPALSTGTISGTVFIDSNQTASYDLQESKVPGVMVTLTGTTAQGNPVNVNAITDKDGNYRFLNVRAGNYQVRTNSQDGLLGGTVLGSFEVTGGQTITQPLSFLGLSPEGISLRPFLSSTGNSALTFLSGGGSGSAQVSGRANNAPILRTAIADISVGKNAADTIIDLAGHFFDEDYANSHVRFVTSSGNINVELFDRETPQTVANFYNYILSNRYDNTIFHRHATNFVLQGGGFQFRTNPSNLTNVVTDPPVRNEFGVSNTLGTIAMAKQEGDPNSATSQFFFNLANNASNLDFQNGGFTVFGRVMDTADQQVINRLREYPIRNQSAFNSALDNLPLRNYTGSNFPTDTTANNYALIRDVIVVERVESLTYTLVSNNNPGLVNATITNNRLRLDYVNDATGTATITVRATDQFGVSVDATFRVNVANQPPTASVALAPTVPNSNSTMTATVTRSDPNNDLVNLTYVWKVNGVEKRTVTTTAVTDTFDLSVAGNGDKNDVITVEVTPNDGTVNGATVTQSVTIPNTAPSINSIVLNPSAPSTNDTLTAAITATDQDGDSMSFTYIWRVNGVVVKTNTTTNLSDALDLSLPGNGDPGDLISVQVTGNDGEASGSPLSTSVTVA